MNYSRADYFQLIGEVMGLKCFKCLKPCNLTDDVHFYDIISNKYEYLKPRDTISVGYVLDTESYKLRVSLDTFLKETIEIQPLEQEPQHSLKNIERFKNSESTNSLHCSLIC